MNPLKGLFVYMACQIFRRVLSALSFLRLHAACGEEALYYARWQVPLNKLAAMRRKTHPARNASTRKTIC